MNEIIFSNAYEMTLICQKKLFFKIISLLMHFKLYILLLHLSYLR